MFADMSTNVCRIHVMQITLSGYNWFIEGNDFTNM